MLVLVDQDGVLADYEAGFYANFSSAYPDAPHIAPRDRTTFYPRDQYDARWHDEITRVQTEPGFYANLPVIPGARNALQTMLELDWQVYICTSPLWAWRNCVAEKFAWIEEHLGAEWIPRIILTKDKTVVRGDVLIDDKPQIVGRYNPVFTHVVYDAPYNRHVTTSPRLTWDTWRPVLDEIDSTSTNLHQPRST